MALTNITETPRTDGIQTTPGEEIAARIRLADFLMTQSGTIYMPDPMARTPFVPGTPPGYFERLEVASSAHDFKLMLAAEGQRASGIEQVMGNGDGAEDSLHFVKH